MNSWIIVEFGELVGYYHSWRVKLTNGASMGSSMAKSDAEYLMKYFQVKSPANLCGKTIKSESDDIFEAFEQLIFSAKYDGKYVPPSDQLIFAKVARALSNMKEPDLSDVDKYTVYRAFQKVYNTEEDRDRWQKWLKNKVRTLSQKRVSLRNARGVKFNNIILGPANYLILVSKNKVQKVTIGPYSEPVTFES